MRPEVSGKVLDFCAHVRDLADRERAQVDRLEAANKAMRAELERLSAEMHIKLRELNDEIEAAHAEGRFEDRDRLIDVLSEVERDR